MIQKRYLTYLGRQLLPRPHISASTFEDEIRPFTNWGKYMKLKIASLMALLIVLSHSITYADPVDAGQCTMILNPNTFPGVGAFIELIKGFTLLKGASHLPACVKSFQQTGANIAIVFQRNGADFYFSAKQAHVTQLPDNLCMPVDLADSLDFYDQTLSDNMTAPYIQQVQLISGSNNGFYKLHYEQFQITKKPVGTGIDQQSEAAVTSIGSYDCD
jgi:hypothetical protein